MYSPSNAMALALIKCGHALDPLAPLATQLHILNLFSGEETPYESLHTVVSCGVKPWFDAFVGARGTGKEGDTKMGIPMTKKKFAELGLSLLHLQQNVEIPETHLIIHPVIQRAAEQSGTGEIWVAVENTYSKQAPRVENQIIAQLHNRLGTARNANEMFRVFSKFNALFVRPKIHGAIQEYQTQLIDLVKEDIKRLHGKFKTQYRFSEAYHMSQMCDLLPIAGAIIWALQIEWQLLAYMKRVEDVLGKGWELYAEGQKLQSESAAFRKKLDRDMAVDGCLFEIVRLCGGRFQLAVNFNLQTITLFKEVQNLLWLGHKMGVSTCSFIDGGGKDIWSNAGLGGKESGEWLVAEYRNNAQQMVAKDGWDNRHIQFVREFASVVSVLQDKTNNVTGLYRDILHAVEDLSMCAYTSEMFSELLSKIQAVVLPPTSIDCLNLEGHTDTNLEHWVAELDKRIEGILLQRLAHIIQVWCSEFDCTIDEEEPPVIGLYMKSDASATVELPMVISAFLSSVSAIIVTTLPNYILATPSCTALPYMFNTSVPVMFGEIIASELATSTHTPILVSPTMNISGMDCLS
ncbi:dynein heavy chain, N-terminal region 1-domain-containing protein [Pisolithus sp. B1]|nr:dynein heavy chain, N-terminal region 1-domain-containing protein [Pisolithus sp. B1]